MVKQKMTIKKYNPLYKLKEVGKDIWIVDGDFVKMSFKLFKVPFSTRMTIIRLENNDLWIHSPIQLTKNLKKEIDLLGNVKYLIAPNKLHYTYIKSWSDEYPNTEVGYAKGLDRKLSNLSSSILFPIYDMNFLSWSDEINHHAFKGSMYVEEVVFYHKKSETLILTDLIENIELEKKNLFYSTLLKLGDNGHPTGRTPRDYRLSFLFGKNEAKKSYEIIKSWSAKNIIISHGQNYFGNGLKVLKEAFFWLEK